MKENENPGIILPGSATPSLTGFATMVLGGFQPTGFHLNYYRVLEAFARGEISKLMVSVPPQHGKSTGSSVLLPAYMLGIDPDLRITLASYNSTLANRFNKRVQRIMDSDRYRTLFPATTIKGKATREDYIRTTSHVEMIGRSGELVSVGREGSLTGNSVDVFILDDLYKDAMEANSPLIRENCWEWYTSVVRTRFHNFSRELMVFTRWHEDDLMGTLLRKEPHILLSQWSQITGVESGTWGVLNFSAIKEGNPTELDPRSDGQALWPERHNIELLESKRNLDIYRFNCMYQGRPANKGGLLYGDRFLTYRDLPTDTIKKGNYTDTADLGDDYLCSICYEVAPDGLIYVTGLVYSRDGMEVTEKQVAELLSEAGTRTALFESNNGGRGFARAVSRLAPAVRIEWFHQSGNKEARILSNSATVTQMIRMPSDWTLRWREFSAHITSYQRNFKLNRWHDGPDVLSGIIEREVLDVCSKKIKIFHAGN